MARYVLKRILMVLVIMVCAAFVIFTILYFTPGDPARNLLGGTATQAEVERMRATLGLDRPYIVQLGDFMYNTFLRLDLGTSWTYSEKVMDVLLNRLPCLHRGGGAVRHDPQRDRGAVPGHLCRHP